jgi:hypothetical protein
MENCVCPPLSEIEDIPQGGCPENIGQIVRLIFIRRGNPIAATAAAAALLATYTAALAAVGDGKIQVSPGLLEALVIPPAEPITEGGDDNSTPLGRQIVVGESTIIVESMIRNVPSASIAVMRKYRCEDLALGFVNEFGEIGFNKQGLEMHGFPVHAFYAGSKGNDGKNTQDKGKIRFGMDADWRDSIVLIKPTDFDPRFDI